ncbi:MAG TPA: DUF1622 domain-containing protein [Caulobacteraceae bacterium]|nr:DUF1622 domain-containing protein [Caulobacteraceae bacterium]
MQAAFRVLASYVALMCNAGAVVILGVAAIEAFVLLVHAAPRLGDQSVKRRIWVRFASWIVLSLEFALAADIVDTAITPSWNDIGQLAAIAAIRTGLNFFLARDIESVTREELARPPSAARTLA